MGTAEPKDNGLPSHSVDGGVVACFVCQGPSFHTHSGAGLIDIVKTNVALALLCRVVHQSSGRHTDNLVSFSQCFVSHFF